MKHFWNCLGLILGLTAWGALGTGCGAPVEGESEEEFSSRSSALTAAFSTQQAVAAGQNHSLALRSNGQVLAWGQNTYGQLGDGTTTSRTAPVSVTGGLPPIQGIAAGLGHSLAVSGDGKAYAWGQNTTGQLGDGTLGNKSTPVQVAIPSGFTVKAVAAGLSHSLALTTDGKVWAWGQNAYAQIGDGTTGGNKTTPVQVTIPGGAVAIAAGWYHSMALGADGRVWVWGRNNTGQVGNGGTANQTTPFAVTLTGTASGIAGGGSHSLARTTSGKVWAWGQNTFGQLGDGTTLTRSTPVQLPSLSDIASLAAGGYFSLAVATDGKAWAWGQNNKGQVGNGSASTTGITTPVAVLELTDATAVAGGTLHALALRPGCPVWAWGANAFGQLGDGTTTDRLAPTQAQLFNTFFMDLEGDGFGNPDPLMGAEGCWAPPGYVDNGLDCDDYDPFINPDAPEVCNGLDDNCADGPDEGNPNGGDSCSTGDLGVCGAGTTVCTGGTLVCTGNVPASTEVCDSQDNDCDGAVDEDNPEGLEQCSTGLSGVCDEGVTYCSAGKVACVQIHAPSSEVCDSKDNDCDGLTDEGLTLSLYYEDLDGDGYGTSNKVVTACAPPPGYATNPSDCNDGNASIKPGATEVCDGVDNNCAAGIDEGLTATYYQDADGDGYGTAAQTTVACSKPTGYAPTPGDCNDGNASIKPGATEVCDSVDNNCNGESDEGLTTKLYFQDADGDGYGNSGNMLSTCATPPGYVINPNDCNDGNASIKPGALEVCDNVDNNCLGGIDEGVKTTYYQDADGDGYGASSPTIAACSAPSGYVANSSDCNDTKAAIKPGATEVCDGVDNNCSGSTDEGVTNVYYRDADNDGYGASSPTLNGCSAPSGYVGNASDCNDTKAAIKPGATEVCDGVDNNCSGGIDEGNPGGNVECDPGCGWGYTVCSGGSLRCELDLVPLEVCRNGEDDDCDGLIDEGCPTCFVAGTPITLADGSTKPIEDMAIGDQVLAYDVESAQVVPAPVTHTFVHENSDGLLLINGSLRATANHPFYANGRWVRADELQVGDELVMLDVSDADASASTRPVKVTSLLMQPQSETTYNIEVDIHHDYFAGGILVHNKEAPAYTCGNGTCESGETAQSCPVDCHY